MTDEGEPSGHLPLIRRASAPPSPQGEGFPRRGGVTPPYRAIKITGQSVGAVIDRPLQPSLQINLTGKRHGRAMLAPTNPPVFPGQHKKFRLPQNTPAGLGWVKKDKSGIVRLIMIKFLNDIRNVEKPISNNRKIINTIAVLLLGIALGTFSKFLDFRQAELPSVLMAIDGALDVHNFLGRFAIWVLIALCISIYSNSAIRASINVFAFFIGMVASYYLYSNYIAGFLPRSYAVIWFGFTAVSPLLSFACWYARGKSKLALILSALILAVLFNMCFVYGCWYFNAKSVLEVIVFIIGLIVLRRDTLRSSALMGTISIVLVVLLDMVIPFHFG